MSIDATTGLLSLPFMRPKYDFTSNPLIQMLLLLVALGIAAVSIYCALSLGTWKPVAIGLVVIVAMEAVLLYFKQHRSLKGQS
jgi:hypothetical protein